MAVCAANASCRADPVDQFAGLVKDIRYDLGSRADDVYVSGALTGKECELIQIALHRAQRGIRAPAMGSSSCCP